MSSVIPFFERIMALHHETFQDAHYSAAYHILAAALHCADDSHDSRQLALVGTIATEQLAWIDANAPAYEHSTQSAARRGHASIYAMLARQAHGKVLVLQRRQHWDTHSPLGNRAQDKAAIKPTE
jgi:hypothetical protein